MARVTVKQVPENEVPTEILASSIVTIADGIKALRSGRLNDRALFLLIQDAMPSNTKVGMRDIRAVFDAAADLERSFIKPKKKAD